MDLVAIADSEACFAAYVEELVGVIGHADRALPLRDYCLGLLMPGRLPFHSSPVPRCHELAAPQAPLGAVLS